MSTLLDRERWKYMPAGLYKFDPRIEGISTSTCRHETTPLKEALCYGLRQGIKLV